MLKKTKSYEPLAEYEEQRLHELEDEALDALADEVNFDPYNYLNGEEKKEYAQLRNRLTEEEIYPEEDEDE